MTRVVWVRLGFGKKLRCVEVAPSEKLVLGVCFAVVALVCLVVLEVVHLFVLGFWNNEVFAAICSLIGCIFGVFVSQRG